MNRLLTGCLVFIALAATSATVNAQQIASQNGFGTTVAIAGDDVFVSEPMNARIPGMLYVYRKDASGQWMEAQVLSADDGHPEDRFSVTIDVDGDRLVTSATRSNDAMGAVYIFSRSDDGTWQQTDKIQPEDVAAGDRFGAGLVLSGDWLFASSTPFEGDGSVHVYKSENGTWTQTAEIMADSTDGNMFGTALAMAGERLLVGSPSNGNGAVHVYSMNEETGSWERSQTIVGRELEPGQADAEGAHMGPFQMPTTDFFGSDLLVEGPYLFVTAPNTDQMTGKVYSYTADGSGMYQGGMTLHPFDAQPQHMFARSLAFTGTQVLVGSIGVDNFTGAIYAMDWDAEATMFTGSRKLMPKDLTQATLFGGAIAANESVVVVGASRDARGYGSAFVYEPSPEGTWSMTAKLGSELQVEYNAITGGTVKCEEGGAADYPCENVDLVSYLTMNDMDAPRGVQTNDVWGWTDSETGKEYALVGRNDATSFIDISDPENPVILGTLMRTEGSPISTWRDVKAYKDHAYIVADGAGAHGVQVFDLRQLRDVENPPVMFEETAHYDGIHSAHNIVINEETGYAYTVGNRSGGETCAGGSHMINIQEPANPVFAGCWAHVETGRQGTGYTHDGQCVIYDGPDERYTGREICLGANETAVSIADVTDKDNPVAISTGNYPNPGYTHQGWLSEDHRYFFVNDELDELNGSTDGTRTLIWDIAELDDPILVNEHVSENKASDHNLYVRGNYMYQSNYVSGLRIVDISDVENPIEVGYFDTVTWGDDRPGFGGSWSNYPFFESGVIVVTSGEEGVFFLKRSDVDI